MDQLTNDVRRNSWLNIITECQQRPASVTAKQWLAENGIKEKAYYYWLRKFCREAGEQMNLPAVTAPAVSLLKYPMIFRNLSCVCSKLIRRLSTAA